MRLRLSNEVVMKIGDVATASNRYRRVLLLHSVTSRSASLPSPVSLALASARFYIKYSDSMNHHIINSFKTNN